MYILYVCMYVCVYVQCIMPIQPLAAIHNKPYYYNEAVGEWHKKSMLQFMSNWQDYTFHQRHELARRY